MSADAGGVRVWRERLATGGPWLSLARVAVLVVPVALAIPAAINPSHYRVDGLIVLLCAGIGAGIGTRLRHGSLSARLRELDREDRRAVWRVLQTGVPSGIPRLDELAAARLEHAVREQRGLRVVAPVIIAAWVASPVVAAVRGSLWWLLCLPSALLLAVIGLDQLRGPPPSNRLEHLNAALADRSRWSGEAAGDELRADDT